MGDDTVRPFDSFKAGYKILAWAGFYRLLNEPKSKLKRICHQVYRPLAFLICLLYNVQHIIFIIQKRNKINDVYDCLMLEIPQLNLLVKYLTLNVQSSKIDKINDNLMNTMFAARSKKDEELLMTNTKNMQRLSMIINIAITFAGVIWPFSFMITRYHDKTYVVPSYVPFETNTWARYTCSVLLEVFPVMWTGYGHIALDCVVAAYYAQAEVQLKIIKYNLEHLFDANNTIQYGFGDYSNTLDEHLKQRFVYYVKRYEKLRWYTREVDNVFNFSTSFQFFTSAVTFCLVIYRMSMTNVLTLPFMFMVLLLVLSLTQVFLYCYYGNQVQYESQLVNSSIYLSDWLSASPQFRRLLLIALERWSRPLAPRASGIIPLSLTTFISIVRFAYRLYAVLSANKANS